MITDTHLDELQNLFVKHGVVLAYLFGSQAEGNARPDSDIDIAVLLPAESWPESFFDVRLSLTNELIGVFHKSEIDVVVLNEAPPLLAHEITCLGHIIYEDPVTQPADQFAVEAFQRYSDTQSIRDIRDTYLFDRLERRVAERALREKRDAEN